MEWDPENDLEAGLAGLDVRSQAFHAFDEPSLDVEQPSSAPAAVTTAHALFLEEGLRVSEQLHQALRSRAAIDQAIGILMSRGGGTAEDALEQLRERSRLGDEKVADVARRLVDQAVARARIRRSGDG